MKNKIGFILYSALFCFAAVSPVSADIELVSPALKGGITKVQAVVKQGQDVVEAGNKLKDATVQGFQGIKDNIEEIVDFATNPTELVKTTVMGAMSDKVDGSANEDEGIENVKETYNRVFGAENNITQAKKLKAAINKEQAESMARLYARSLILRQELAEEKDKMPSLDTIDDAFEANNEVMIRSLRRWNKILEMQAHINHYKNTISVQNFVNEEEEDGNEAN